MNWKDVNIKRGKELYELEKDPYYEKDPIGKLTQQICIVTDKDIEWVEALPLEDVMIYKNELEFLGTTPDGNFEKEFEIDGVVYHFIDLSNLTFGEWIDLDTYCKDPLNLLESIIATLYRPVGEKYDPSKVPGRAELFLQKCSYETAAGAALFFSLFVMDSIRPTKGYSITEQLMMDLMKKRDQMKGSQLVVEGKHKNKKRANNSNGS